MTSATCTMQLHREWRLPSDPNTMRPFKGNREIVLANTNDTHFADDHWFLSLQDLQRLEGQTESESGTEMMWSAFVTPPPSYERRWSQFKEHFCGRGRRGRRGRRSLERARVHLYLKVARMKSNRLARTAALYTQGQFTFCIWMRQSEYCAICMRAIRLHRRPNIFIGGILSRLASPLSSTYLAPALHASSQIQLPSCQVEPANWVACEFVARSATNNKN